MEAVNYQLEQFNFNGPLDLLLSLIQKNKIEITDLPIALLCDQYLEAIAGMEELDMELASDFLLMASELIYIKSKMMLPREEKEEKDPRMELTDALLRYQAAKEASVKMTKPGVIRIGSSQRSCVTAARRAAAAKMEACFVLAGAVVKHEGEYPGWAPAAESPVRDACVASYKKLFGVEPKVKAIHAGLECGLFTEKFPGLDMISFGPTLRGVHAPGERLDLASLDKFVALLVDLIQNYK